jgi:hypothetical protein
MTAEDLLAFDPPIFSKPQAKNAPRIPSKPVLPAKE